MYLTFWLWTYLRQTSEDFRKVLKIILRFLWKSGPRFFGEVLRLRPRLDSCILRWGRSGAVTIEKCLDITDVELAGIQCTDYDFVKKSLKSVGKSIKICALRQRHWTHIRIGPRLEKKEPRHEQTRELLRAKRWWEYAQVVICVTCVVAEDSWCQKWMLFLCTSPFCQIWCFVGFWASKSMSVYDLHTQFTEFQLSKLVRIHVDFQGCTVLIICGTLSPALITWTMTPVSESDSRCDMLIVYFRMTQTQHKSRSLLKSGSQRLDWYNA